MTARERKLTGIKKSASLIKEALPIGQRLPKKEQIKKMITAYKDIVKGKNVASAKRTKKMWSGAQSRRAKWNIANPKKSGLRPEQKAFHKAKSRVSNAQLERAVAIGVPALGVGGLSAAALK